MFCKKGALRNFAKITGKHLCQGLFFNKVAGRGRVIVNVHCYGKPLSSSFQIYVGEIVPFPCNIMLILYHIINSFLYHS